ncbi:MAG: GNAT family N-acetyltransferase [Isosphaeraceae bacterium]|nr:GNAT family N-acetyltransferase [Isosphaeraceae bacterium]
MALAEPEVIACPPEERVAALGILYRRVSASLRPRLVADAVQEAEAGTIDLSGLWIARRRGRVVGTLLTQTLAGRAAAVWAPEVEGAWRRSATAVALVRAALANLSARGFRVAQALLDDSAPRHAAADLTAGGMPRVTDLLYLERDTALPLAVAPGVPLIDWQGLTHATEADFRAVLQGTYAASLDMPELEGVRSLDDILASHRAGGRFAPERWQVGHVRGEPEAAAVLLLSELPDRDAWEVAYLGLTVPARGRGLGRAVLAHAIDLAAPYVGRIELAVDLRNTPAHALYRLAGMTPFDRRAVHLAMLHP